MDPPLVFCDAKIGISEATKLNIPELRRVFNNIINQRCSLEIIGVAKFSPNSENDHIITVKVIEATGFSTSSIPIQIPSQDTLAAAHWPAE